MGILNFKPTRGKYADDSAPVIADLDALVAEPVHFKWQGNKHTIKPFSQKQFLMVMNRYSKIINEVHDSKMSRTEQLSMFADLFSECCDTIALKEVEQMTDAQIGALMQLIIDSVTGRIHGDSKKKVNQNHITQST